MKTKSPEELTQEYIDIFGERDGQIVTKITNSVSNMFLQWRVFIYLYGGPPERVAVLNAASGRMANLLQGLIWDSVILRIRRLTDPERSGKNKQLENLSLEQLVRIARDRAVQLDLESLKVSTFEKCKPARDYADKYLAHADLPHALGFETTEIRRFETTNAIRAIGAFVNEFHKVNRDTDFRFTPFSSGADEAQFLLMLHLGNSFYEQEKARRLDLALQGNWKDAEETWIPAWIYGPSEFEAL